MIVSQTPMRFHAFMGTVYYEGIATINPMRTALRYTGAGPHLWSRSRTAWAKRSRPAR